MNIPPANLQTLFEVTPGERGEEIKEIRRFLDQFGQHLPYEIRQNYEKIAARLR